MTNPPTKAECERAIACLAVELPGPVYDDFATLVRARLAHLEAELAIPESDTTGWTFEEMTTSRTVWRNHAYVLERYIERLKGELSHD